MKKHWFAAVSVMALLASSAPVDAKDGHGRGHANGKAKVEKHESKKIRGDTTPGVTAVRARTPIRRDTVIIDRDGDRRIVTEFFRRESLPPGLAKRQSLPPGLAKQLRERGHLPPGLQKRLVAVPRPLAARFPGLPAHYNRYFVGRDLIVVDDRTNTVVAVMPNVL